MHSFILWSIELLNIQDGTRPPSWISKKLVSSPQRFDRSPQNYSWWRKLVLLNILTVKNSIFVKIQNGRRPPFWHCRWVLNRSLLLLSSWMSDATRAVWNVPVQVLYSDFNKTTNKFVFMLEAPWLNPEIYFWSSRRVIFVLTPCFERLWLYVDLVTNGEFVRWVWMNRCELWTHRACRTEEWWWTSHATSSTNGSSFVFSTCWPCTRWTFFICISPTIKDGGSKFPRCPSSPK